MRKLMNVTSLLIFTLLCISIGAARQSATAQTPGQVPAQAPHRLTIEGKVFEVTDGDSVTILDSSNKQHRIQLLGIDAPEKDQVFGSKSRLTLSGLVLNKQVKVQYEEDKSGRIRGKVLLDGRDINLEQIKAGLAWHNKPLEKYQSAEDRRLYAEAEQTARATRRGLWIGASPQPPWEFRKERAKLKEMSAQQPTAGEAAKSEEAKPQATPTPAAPKMNTSDLDKKINEAVQKASAQEATEADKQAAAAAFVERGDRHYNSGQQQFYKQALEDYRQALRYQPDNAGAREKIGIITAILQSLGHSPQ